jgi:heme/copper-type cytochrome/quinol oxidase subunit 1
MKSIITAILVGIIIVSLSVSVHHFMTDGIAEKSNMSLGVLTTVQGIMSGVVFLVTKFLSKI